MSERTRNLLKAIIPVRCLPGHDKIVDNELIVKIMHLHKASREEYQAVMLCCRFFKDIPVTDKTDITGISIDVDPDWFFLSRAATTSDLISSNNCEYVNLGTSYAIVAPDEATASQLRLSL